VWLQELPLRGYLHNLNEDGEIQKRTLSVLTLINRRYVEMGLDLA